MVENHLHRSFILRMNTTLFTRCVIISAWTSICF
nr:MAG TPA: hypothetical protein [Caudoviricetes sp.]